MNISRHKISGRRGKVELDLSNYAGNAEKNTAGVDISKFAKKVDLAKILINWKMY